MNTVTHIVITLQVEGQHCWPDAAKFHPPVSFLAHPHRHIFHIKMAKEVTHDDRDVEIILFKREVEDYFKRNYFKNSLGMCDFKSMSCEMIAKDLIEVYDAEWVQVLEDGENGATCTKLRSE